jgi:TetR/AcrR family transcriptional regulator
MPNSQTRPHKTRIQQKREKLILDCALDVFATYGFHGATLDQIATKAEISKPNLLYYFKSKEHVYQSLLERTMDGWLDPFLNIAAQGDPVIELTRYIEAKMDISFSNPLASRLFAIEIQSGAAVLKGELQSTLKAHVDDKAAIITAWMEQGKLRPVDSYHLIFAIWSLTQHYADFAVQIEALLGPSYDRKAAKQAVVDILLRGLVPATITPLR